MAKSKVKAEPKPELVYEIEGAPPKLFVIKHRPSDLWWRPNKAGYTPNLLLAGTYTEEQARSIEATTPLADADELTDCSCPSCKKRREASA